MHIDGTRFEWLADDLDAGFRELLSPFASEPTLWERARPGKWTGGQQVEHVAVTLSVFADAFQARRASVTDGTLEPRPRRGVLQGLFIGLVLPGGRLPRGGRAPATMLPAAHPMREDVEARIARDLAEMRALGAKLTPAQRDTLWIWNPILPRWHYTFSEAQRIQAIHARHHAIQVREIAARG